MPRHQPHIRGIATRTSSGAVMQQTSARHLDLAQNSAESGFYLTTDSKIQSYLRAERAFCTEARRKRLSAHVWQACRDTICWMRMRLPARLRPSLGAAQLIDVSAERDLKASSESVSKVPRVGT